MPITSPRATAFGFGTAPLWWPDTNEWLRKVAETANLVMDGKINATGTITLTNGASSTTLTDARIGRTTKVFLIATTSDAADEVKYVYQTFPNATTGEAVINHSTHVGHGHNHDLTFAYALLG